MTFTVLWTPRAERDLTSIWTSAKDRTAVSSAANGLDALLRSEPQNKGESRFGTVRVVFVPPLGIDLQVMEKDRKVYVLRVWRTDRR